MEGWVTGCSGIFHDNTVEPSIIGFAHGRGYAYVSAHAGDNEVFDSFVAEQELEIGVGKGPFTRFVDDRFPR